MINSERKFDWFSLVIGILWVILGAAAINSPSTAISVIAVFVGIGALAKGIYTLWLRRGDPNVDGQQQQDDVADCFIGGGYYFRNHSPVPHSFWLWHYCLPVCILVYLRFNFATGDRPFL